MGNKALAVATRVPYSRVCVEKRRRAFSEVVMETNFSEVVLNTNFDIFKRLQNGRPLWITAVPGIDEARARVDRLEAIAPGEYFIYSQTKGIVVEYVNA
jgi:hypothetical protein